MIERGLRVWRRSPLSPALSPEYVGEGGREEGDAGVAPTNTWEREKSFKAETWRELEHGSRGIPVRGDL